MTCGGALRFEKRYDELDCVMRQNCKRRLNGKAHEREWAGYAVAKRFKNSQALQNNVVSPVTSTGRFSTNKILLGKFCWIGAAAAEEDAAEDFVAVAFWA
jgi:hypothetical protein